MNEILHNEGRHDGRYHRHHNDREGKRPFAYGEIRLLLLSRIVEKPSDGDDFITTIEERMGGSYAPSPGFLYPTAARLENRGYATINMKPPGRKRCRIPSKGETFLLTNKASASKLVAKARARHADGVAPAPVSAIRVTENVKLALRLRLRGWFDARSSGTIAGSLYAAAQAIQRS
jgi:DNA-binding PadR family transcriptional regulator